MIKIMLDIPNTLDILKWVSENLKWVIIGAGFLAVVIIVLDIIKFTKFTRQLIYNMFHEKLFWILMFAGLITLFWLLNKYSII